VPAGSSFGTWLGWVVDPDRPVVVLVDTPEALDDIARQAIRIGFDSIVGYVDGGLRAWRAAGRTVQAGATYDVDRLAAQLSGDGGDRPLVIDVRQATEFEAGHVPGSVHIGAGELPAMLDELPRDRPIVTMCASGYRSSVAASMLRAAGFERVAAVNSGLPTWEARGYPVEYGGADAEPPSAAPTVTVEGHAH
jgi:hydroxyacylglutathione hydrolase